MFVNRIKICPDLHKLQLWFSRIRQCLFFKLLRQWTHKMGHFLSTIKHSHPYRSAAHVLSSTYCLKLNVNTSVVIYFGRESNEGQFLTSNCVGKVPWMNVVYKKGHKGLTFIKKLINNSRGKYKRNECLINVCKSDTDLSWFT
jgi:hypothetical protein